MSVGFRDKLTKRIKHIRSLRFTIAAIIMVCSIVPLFIMDGVVVSSYKTREMDNRLIEVQGQCNILEKDITDGKYTSNEDTSVVDSEIEQIAYTYSARVIITDENGYVLTDTYNYDTGKSIISSSVISALAGSSTSHYDNKTGYAEVTIPVTSTMGDIKGTISVTMSDDSISDVTTYIARIMTAITAVFFIVLLIIAVVISNIIVRPLGKLSQSIVKVSNGVRDGHVEHRTLYEYNVVSDSVNIMLDRIKSLDDSRQEFVSNVSHELKTPMTSMKVLADSLLSQNEATVDVYREFMQDIVEEIDRENQIISDLLTLVKMDRSSSDLNITTVNVNELIELVLKRIRPIAVTKNIELVFESFRPVAAEIDEVKFTLAITNLVENAIKYNVQDGWVRVTLNADHRYFYIKVSDSGIGIPNDCKEHIFERFYRVDKARSRETGGTGLGLAITKNVVVMHKGIIKLYSKENEGTTFTVRIPLYYVRNGGED